MLREDADKVCRDMIDVLIGDERVVINMWCSRGG